MRRIRCIFGLHNFNIKLHEGVCYYEKGKGRGKHYFHGVLWKCSDCSEEKFEPKENINKNP